MSLKICRVITPKFFPDNPNLMSFFLGDNPNVIYQIIMNIFKTPIVDAIIVTLKTDTAPSNGAWSEKKSAELLTIINATELCHVE